ncbi:alpha/beta hydrolase [Kocuria tytonis]|uniref:Alpha/beta fold hydrolase n=1 Tax=Kocuria tytonis TaxID=2054280 RepID=A0A495A215_9MICC|nr:alpha/beta fold hydrolase [Kocuria tytonis]RKQ33102.1 alpha/beta fold hydrolase [Kocuria tytonis]
MRGITIMGETSVLTYSRLGRSLRPTRNKTTSDTTAGVSHGWVPAGERWIAVDVHEPALPARGATVVLAAPPGRERVTMTRTVVHTARALAADGWRVVRFDWSGTGQSPAHIDATDAQLWAEDLRVVRDWAGQGEPVSGVGFSLAGALLAADDDAGWAHRLVLAPVSGKQWLRHQSALRRMAGADLPPRITDGTELMDLHLTATGAASVKAVPAPTADGSRRIELLDEAQTGPLPLDVHPRAATVPDRVTSAVVQAVGAQAPARGSETRSAVREPSPAQDITVDVDGAAVRLRRTTNGSAQRPAIITEPLDRAPAAPGLALVSPGSDVMEAAGGLWLRTALLASARGAVCLLAERSDTGELVYDHAPWNTNPYARHTVVECRELLEHIGQLTEGPLFAAGICLGAWGLVACARELPAELAGRLTLYVINNIGWQRAPLRYWRQGVRSGPLAPRLPGEDAPAPTEDAAAAPTGSTGRSLRRVLTTHVGNAARTVVRGTRARAHEASPRVNALAATLGIIDVPHPALRQLSRIPGLTVNAVFGPADAAHSNATPGRTGPRSAMLLLEPLDHSVFATASRNTLTEYVVGEVTGRAAAAR